jgi:hypothetical protein
VIPPVLAPGLHELTLARAGEPVIGYAISTPPTYRHSEAPQFAPPVAIISYDERPGILG